MVTYVVRFYKTEGSQRLTPSPRTFKFDGCTVDGMITYCRQMYLC